MNYQKIIEFVTQNPVCSLATVENDQPHVRGFLSNVVEEKIYFTTSSCKQVGAQILQNQKVELCYYTPDFSQMLRITSTIEIVEDIQMKQFFIDTKEYLKGFRADDPSFLLLTLSDSEAWFWTIQDNMQEEKIARVMF